LGVRDRPWPVVPDDAMVALVPVPRTLLRTVAATVALVALLASTASAAAATPTISGPSHVTPGAVARFVIHGFAPARPVSLTVEPTRCGAPTCRYGDGNTAWLPDLRGDARITIRWPATSAEGRGAAVFSTDRRGARFVPWKAGALARVRVCPQWDKRRCASRLVRIT
jgi:hypothetical protein